MRGSIISLEVRKEAKSSLGCTFTNETISRNWSGPGVYGFRGHRIITAGGCGAEFTACYIGTHRNVEIDLIDFSLNAHG